MQMGENDDVLSAQWEELFMVADYAMIQHVAFERHTS
jgi:hypothetical protein